MQEGIGQATAMEIRFEAISETRPGAKWQALFNRLWPAYRAWYLKDAIDNRATYHECTQALEKHMPEFVPAYEKLCELAGGGDLEARFLSLYKPPPYLSGCSQAVWPGEPPFLVRNYDYSPDAFDAVALKTAWLGRRVIGMSDCLVGLTDGMNEDGLVLSLTFGGRRAVGPGFGVPIILRYVLETCTAAPEALNALGRIPCHMSYNVTALDLQGRCGTVYLAPDRAPHISSATVSTNHQRRVEWASHALATASVERERFLLRQLMEHKPSGPDLVAGFLKPPLHSTQYKRGFGTLFTSIYTPRSRHMDLLWPGLHWPLPLESFTDAHRLVHYLMAHDSATPNHPGSSPASVRL